MKKTRWDITARDGRIIFESTKYQNAFEMLSLRKGHLTVKMLRKIHNPVKCIQELIDSEVINAKKISYEDGDFVVTVNVKSEKNNGKENRTT